MSSITQSNTRQEQSEANTVDITSPYTNEVEMFDNAELSDFVLVVPGLTKPLELHKLILAKASRKVKSMLKGKGEQQVEWPFDINKQVDRQALVKALRFCYGETLSVGTNNGECISMIATLSRLQVTCLEEVVPKLIGFALNEARNDVRVGVELLKACTRYEECCNTNTCTLNKELAKTILTRENMAEHFREVVDDCLMTLPPEYLDEVVFGEPHTKCSEFYLRAKYLRWHSKEMSFEEKQKLLGVCDWSTLNSQELRELRLADFVDKDELLMAYERALEYCENENEQMRMKRGEIVKDKEKENKRVGKAESEKKNPELLPVEAPLVDEISEDISESKRLLLSQRYILFDFFMTLTDKSRMAL